MNWMHRYISRRTFMILFNGLSLFYVWAKGQLDYTIESLFAITATMIIMNFLVWRSTRHFPDWK